MNTSFITPATPYTTICAACVNDMAFLTIGFMICGTQMSSPGHKLFQSFLKFFKAALYAPAWGSFLLRTKVFHLPDDFYLIIRIDIHPVNQRVRQPSRQATGTNYFPRQFRSGAFRFFVHFHL